MRPVQLRKAFAPIIVTVSGMLTDSSAVHPENISCARKVVLEPKVTLFRLTQFLNSALLVVTDGFAVVVKEVTPSGKVMLTMPDALKVAEPTLVSAEPSSKITDFREVQFSKSLLPSVVTLFGTVKVSISGQFAIREVPNTLICVPSSKVKEMSAGL